MTTVEGPTVTFRKLYTSRRRTKDATLALRRLAAKKSEDFDIKVFVFEYVEGTQQYVLECTCSVLVEDDVDALLSLAIGDVGEPEMTLVSEFYHNVGLSRFGQQ